MAFDFSGRSTSKEKSSDPFPASNPFPTRNSSPTGNAFPSGNSFPAGRDQQTITPHRPSGGFQDLPKKRSRTTELDVPREHHEFDFHNPGKTGWGYPGRRKARSSYRTSPRGSIIPGRWIVFLCEIVGLLLLLWLFRDEISYFLSQLLSWVIVILIIIALVKWFIFPRRRR